MDMIDFRHFLFCLWFFEQLLLQAAFEGICGVGFFQVRLIDVDLIVEVSWLDFVVH